MNFRSRKHLAEYVDVREFLSHVERKPCRLSALPSGLSRNDIHKFKEICKQRNVISMSLPELDRQLELNRQRLKEIKGRKMVFGQCFPSLTLVDGVINPCTSTNGNYVVDMDHSHYQMLINRKKHAMREAWVRINTVDMRFKTESMDKVYHLQSNKSHKTTTLVYPCSKFIFQEDMYKNVKSKSANFTGLHVHMNLRYRPSVITSQQPHRSHSHSVSKFQY